MMMRRFGLMVCAASLGLAALATPMQASAQYIGGCALAGTANFNPGLSATGGSFAYTFTGTLSQCNSSGTAPTDGTIEAGQQVTSNGVKYQEPIPQGQGSCGNGTTQGEGIVTWSDGTISVVQYTTTSAAAGVNLQGIVIPSVTLNQVGGTGSITVTTTRSAGDTVQGALAFGSQTPQDCAGTGLASASINGLVSLYSTSNDGSTVLQIARLAALKV